MTSRSNPSKSGDAMFAKMERVNSELLALSYGSLVTQLLKDMEHVDNVNTQLEKMGYNIGVRLIEEFLSKSQVSACQDFAETADVIAKVGFKMFLGVSGEVTNWSKDNLSCSIILVDNPLVHFVELPQNMQDLSYSNLICGVIRGALEQVHLRVSCTFLKDVLKGDDVNEIRLELKEVLKDEFMEDDY
eukprot:Lankesteria_metandrocarpae@DN7228_c0_g1_i1.p1